MRTIIVVLIGSFLSCKSPVDKKLSSDSTELADFKSKVDSILNSNLDPNEPGVAVLVSFDGEMVVGKGFGVRDLESQQRITKSTNLELASVSKQFTALAVLSLVDKGQLSLTDTVFKFFPYESFRDVTVQQLINHTSGIEDAESDFYLDWDSTKIASNNDVLNWCSEKNRKKYEPGQVFQYNNGAYEILPLLVEKVSGEKFEKYIRQNVFEKAGMGRTTVYNLRSPTYIDERAFYYHKDSSGNWNKMDGHPLTGLLGAGGVYSNIEDYFNYDKALRNNSILSKNMHSLIFQPSAKADTLKKGMSYSMGWLVNDSVAEHSGGWFGVNTYTKRYLKVPLTIAFFSNTDDFMGKNLIEKIDSLAYQFVIDR